MLADILQTARRQGAAVVLAHPYRYRDAVGSTKFVAVDTEGSSPKPATLFEHVRIKQRAFILPNGTGRHERGGNGLSRSCEPRARCDR